MHPTETPLGVLFVYMLRTLLVINAMLTFLHQIYIQTKAMTLSPGLVFQTFLSWALRVSCGLQPWSYNFFLSVRLLKLLPNGTSTSFHLREVWFCFFRALQTISLLIAHHETEYSFFFSNLSINRELIKKWRLQRHRQRHKSMIWLIEWGKIMVLHMRHTFWWRSLPNDDVQFSHLSCSDDNASPQQ